MKIGILADSHINFDKTKKEEVYLRILKALSNTFNQVDHIIHAGDVLMEEFISDLEQIAPCSVVRGNTDFVQKWPKILKLSFQGIPVVVAHEPEHYFQLTEKPRVFIHGHTHYPRIQENNDGCLIINPGSLTKPRRSPYLIRGFSENEKIRPSVAILTIEADVISAIIRKL